MCTPFPGRGVELPIKFSKSEGLAGPQLLEGGCWERGGHFFQGGGCNFHTHTHTHTHTQLRYEILNDKKSL